jgi:hypothetical protein
MFQQKQNDDAMVFTFLKLLLRFLVRVPSKGCPEKDKLQCTNPPYYILRMGDIQEESDPSFLF